MIVVLSGRGRELVLRPQKARRSRLRFSLGQGELLGELSLLDGHTRSADATALEVMCVPFG